MKAPWKRPAGQLSQAAGILLSLIFASSNARAADIEAVQQATEFSKMKALELCATVKSEGSTHTTKVAGEVHATLSGLLRKLLELGITGSTSHETSNYQNVRQEDLAVALSNEVGCRERVFISLIARIPAPDSVPSNQGAFANPVPNPQPRYSPAPTTQRGWLQDGRTGCFIWEESAEPGETATWSGACVGGKASGAGTAEFRTPTAHQYVAGVTVEGRFQGPATFVEDSYRQGQLIRVRRTGMFVAGNQVPSFATVWIENDGIQISGYADPRNGGRMLGNAFIVGQNYRFEGPLDDRQRPHGRGILTVQGRPPVPLTSITVALFTQLGSGCRSPAALVHRSKSRRSGHT